MKHEEINETLRQVMAENSEVFEILNKNARRRLLRQDNIAGFARTLLRYVFGKKGSNRTGTLKRLQYLLAEMAKGNWMKLELLYAYYENKAVSHEALEPYNSAADLSSEHM